MIIIMCINVFVHSFQLDEADPPRHFVSMPCGHVFCGTCVDQIQTQREEQGQLGLACPTCHRDATRVQCTRLFW